MTRWLLIVALLPVAGFAQEPEPGDRAGVYKPMENWEYYCTDSTGNRVDVGQVICITASCQTWTARCEMSGNNNMAIWRKMQDGCPGASLIDRIERLQPALDTGPVHTKV